MSAIKGAFLHEEQAILEGMSVSGRLEAGDAELLLANEQSVSSQDEYGDYQQTTYSFNNSKQDVHAKLQLTSYKHALIASIDSHVEQENVFFKQKSYAAQQALTVSMPQFPRLERALAFYHFNEWWTRPVFRSGELNNMPSRIQSVLWNIGKEYVFLLPIPSPDWKIELNGSEDGLLLSLSPEMDGIDRCKTPIFILMRGENPYKLVEAALEQAHRLTGRPLRLREERTYPDALNYLGWCSWDAFYQEVSEQGIVDKLEELKEKQVPVKWVMIDDGWQSVRDKMMLSFAADEAKFPQGLDTAVKRMKQDFGVQWVGVWHTLFGYWGGIHPDSPIAAELGNYLYETRNGKRIPYPEAARGFGFWNAFHSHLSRAGIDMVKVDSQGAVANFLTHHMPSGQAAAELHTALEASTGIHFDQRLINCMGMTSENIWSRPASAISRNSDDFVPGKEISFKEHALQNAYNSLYHGLMYWGDWDMFWTRHEEAKQNAVLRAVSGGPVYFSDRVGATDPQDILPLILADGRVLRGDHPGLPTPDMLLIDPHQEKVPLKVWNTLGDSAVMAWFNLHEQDAQVEGSCAAAELPPLSSSDCRYVYYDYYQQEARELAAHEQINYTLKANETALGLFIPKKAVCTPIGLIGKFLAPLTVETVVERERRVVYRLAEAGEFGFVADEAPAAAFVNGVSAAVAARSGFFTLDAVADGEQNAPVLIELEWA